MLVIYIADNERCTCSCSSSRVRFICIYTRRNLKKEGVFPPFSSPAVAARNSRTGSNDPNKRNHYSELQKRETLILNEMRSSTVRTELENGCILWRSTCVKRRKNADVSEEDYLMMWRRCTRGTGSDVEGRLEDGTEVNEGPIGPEESTN